MAGSGGGKGSGFLGLLVIGFLIWLFVYIVNNLWTILSYAAGGVAIVGLGLSLAGHLAGAPRGDRNDTRRQRTGRQLRLYGAVVWATVTALVTSMAISQSQQGWLKPGLYVAVASLVIYALAYGISALLALIFKVVRQRFDGMAGDAWAEAVNEDHATWREKWREKQAREAAQGKAEERADQTTGNRHDSRQDGGSAQEQERRRAEDENKRQEETRRRQEEDARRKGAEDARSARSGGLAITTVPDALNYLEMAKPFTAKELDRKRKMVLLRAHPDHGGTNTMARLVNEAYEVLKPISNG